ncbi:hypothetical protein JOM56_005647 [Amanita muscaria]
MGYLKKTLVAILEGNDVLRMKTVTCTPDAPLSSSSMSPPSTLSQKLLAWIPVDPSTVLNPRIPEPLKELVASALSTRKFDISMLTATIITPTSQAAAENLNHDMYVVCVKYKDMGHKMAVSGSGGILHEIGRPDGHTSLSVSATGPGFLDVRVRIRQRFQVCQGEKTGAQTPDHSKSGVKEDMNDSLSSRTVDS